MVTSSESEMKSSSAYPEIYDESQWPCEFDVPVPLRTHTKFTLPTIEIQVRSQQYYNPKIVVPLKIEWNLTMLTVEIHADSRW
jgi:hypothetical protein